MTYTTCYLTTRESGVWDLRRRDLSQSEIGRRLGITRQAVNKALGIIDGKIEQAFYEAVATNNLEIRSINLVEGVMEAYSPAYRIPVIVSLSKANGLKVWHLYEGNCSSCSQRKSCRRMLFAEAEERGIDLSREEKAMQPTHLSLKIYSRYIR